MLQRGVAHLRNAGCVVTELELPEAFSGLIEARRIIARAEGGAAFLAEQRLFGERLHPNVRKMVIDRPDLSAGTVRAAYDLASSCRSAFDEIAGGYDAVLAPSAPGEAPHGLGATGEPVFNEMWTLLHVPCVNVPGFHRPVGLPVGLTLTGPRFADYQVLAAAEVVAACLAATQTAEQTP